MPELNKEKSGHLEPTSDRALNDDRNKSRDSQEQTGSALNVADDIKLVTVMMANLKGMLASSQSTLS